jgi:hypothetical protein
MAQNMVASNEERFAAVMKGLQDGTKYKDEGNLALKAGDVKGAMRHYHFVSSAENRPANLSAPLTPSTACGYHVIYN